MIFGDIESRHMRAERLRKHAGNHVQMIIRYINHIAAIVARLRKLRQLSQLLLQ